MKAKNREGDDEQKEVSASHCCIAARTDRRCLQNNNDTVVQTRLLTTARVL